MANRRSRYEQSFTVPQFLDLEKITASHKHGMLRLTVALKDSVKPHRIQIEGVGKNWSDSVQEVSAVATLDQKRPDSTRPRPTNLCR